MKILRLLAVSATGLTLTLLAGCGILSPKYIEPQEHDLTVPATPVEQINLEFGAFRNLSGSDRRFLYRGLQGRMFADDYNRWLLSPDQMLERQLHKALQPHEARGGDEEKLYRIGGTIYRFEFDRKMRAACVTIDYVIRVFENRRSVGSYNLSITTERAIAGDTPAAAAAAMSGAVEESIVAVRKFLLEINDVKTK